MKQATIQLKNRIENVRITNNHLEMEKFILHVMLATIAGLAILYVLILGNMVFNIVQRKALEKEALALSNEVGNLELSYLSALNSVDVALSSSMGFKDIKPTFVTLKSSLGSIRHVSNEI